MPDTASFRRPARRRRAFLLVAAVALLLVGTAVGIARTPGEKPGGMASSGQHTDAQTGPLSTPPSGSTRLQHAQWIGLLDIEVKAPAGWAPLYEPTHPECINVSHHRVGRAAAARGYLVIGVPYRIIESIYCIRKHRAGDPDASFGQLPFPLWRPYVKVVPASPALAESSVENRDTTREYRGWRLTRKTYGDVQVSVLSAPGDDGLGAAVLGSARRVATNHLGCAVDSSVLDDPDVDAAPLPSPADVAGVVICDYVRGRRGRVLTGSRVLTVSAARRLVTAIQEAPPVPRPRPEPCLRATDRALTLLFLEAGRRPAASAYVSLDSCAENGIVVPGRGTLQLTRGDCAPLFSEPPIGLFIFSTGADACRTTPDDDNDLVPDEFR